MMKLLAAAAILLFASGSPVVAVASPSWSEPGQQPADPGVNDLVDRALAFWRQHGDTACPLGVTTWQAPTLPAGDGIDAWGRGDGATCELWVSQNLADNVETPVFYGEAINTCQAVTHEVGHALGLPHAPKGVMASGPVPPRPHAWAPPFCRRWARFEVRAELHGQGFTDREIRRYHLLALF